MFYSGMLYAKSRQVIISAAFQLRAKGGTLCHHLNAENVRKILGMGFSLRDLWLEYFNTQWACQSTKCKLALAQIVECPKTPYRCYLSKTDYLKSNLLFCNGYSRVSRTWLVKHIPLHQYSSYLQYSIQDAKYLRIKYLSSSLVVTFTNRHRSFVLTLFILSKNGKFFKEGYNFHFFRDYFARIVLFLYLVMYSS